MRISIIGTYANGGSASISPPFIFAGPVIEKRDTRKEYGELRMLALGEVEGIVLAVIYTDREDVRRIISARRASKKERAEWQSFARP